MDTVNNHLRKRLNPQVLSPSLQELRKSQWSRPFETLMRNRLIMGALRYETMANKRKSNHSYDMIGSAITRLQAYQETGNMEHLVDVANLCMLEYDAPSHRSPNWSPTDDGEHVQKKN